MDPSFRSIASYHPNSILSQQHSGMEHYETAIAFSQKQPLTRYEDDFRWEKHGRGCGFMCPEITSFTELCNRPHRRPPPPIPHHSTQTSEFSNYRSLWARIDPEGIERCCREGKKYFQDEASSQFANRLKYPETPYILPQDPPILILPNSAINEVRNLPESQISFVKEIKRIFHYEYTGIGEHRPEVRAMALQLSGTSHRLRPTFWLKLY